MLLDDIQRLLEQSTVVRNPQIVELIPYGQSAFRVKLRAAVTAELTFQVWLNYNGQRTRYAYQLFGEGQPILRWDNAPHHPEWQDNFPHHAHNEFGLLSSSTLTGVPVVDIPIVLNEIDRYLKKTTATFPTLD